MNFRSELNDYLRQIEAMPATRIAMRINEDLVLRCRHCRMLVSGHFGSKCLFEAAEFEEMPWKRL